MAPNQNEQKIGIDEWSTQELEELYALASVRLERLRVGMRQAQEEVREERELCEELEEMLMDRRKEDKG